MRFIMQFWSDETRPAAPDFVSALAHYNERLEQAGVLLAAEGLVKCDAGLRITMVHGERELRPSSARDTPRLGAGFWILRAHSHAEAAAWAKLCPLMEGDVLELRELYGPPELMLIASQVALA